MSSFFKKTKFTDLEGILLARLREALPQPASEILLEQLANIDHIRRLADSREVLCYRKKHPHRPARAFPAKQAELKFATISFHTNDLKTTGHVDFYLVSGFFFSMIITPSPTHIRGGVHIDSVKILYNPMTVWAETTIPIRPIARNSVRLPIWILELESRRQTEVTELREPLDDEARAEFLKRIDSPLPQDYLELMEITEGLTLNGLSILGLTQIYEIVLPDWNYYLLGDLRDSGALATKVHGEIPDLYFLDYGGGPSKSIGDTLAAAVEVLLPYRVDSGKTLG